MYEQEINNEFSPKQSENLLIQSKKYYPDISPFMAGIYIHIPFCKQACHYCDFHFSTSLKYKDELLKALLLEIELRQNYLDSEEIASIYLGGGTPSILSGDELSRLFDKIDSLFRISSGAEITLEANPDDLTVAKLKELKNTPVNRFSIGIQSFFDADLRWMNRAHSAAEAMTCVPRSQDAGFENITIDLIYGLPDLSNENWLSNIDRAAAMSINHLSCYSLTVEPKTALASFIKKGTEKALDEEKSATQFQLLIERSKEKGFNQYEISNFARGDHYSIHNTNYWKGKNYLGIGPSAHSFNGDSRQWNVANNSIYIDRINKNEIPCELECLSLSQRFNEYIMVSLRTSWGCDLNKIKLDFSPYYTNLMQESAIFIERGWLEFTNEHLVLTDSGKLFADKISSELFSMEASEEL